MPTLCDVTSLLRAFPRASSSLAVAALAVGSLSLVSPTAEAAEFTDLMDAADDKDDYDEDTYDPFDISFEPQFSFDSSKAIITREAPCMPQDKYDALPEDSDITDRIKNNPRLQVGNNACDETTVIENSEMIYRNQEFRAGLELRVGMFKDLELRLNAPFVINSRHRLKYAEGVSEGNSSVDPSDDRIKSHAKNVFTDGNNAYSDASNVSRLSNLQQHRFFDLSNEFSDIERAGFADPSIGVHWAPYNDQRDDTKATLLLGFDYTMPIAPIRQADNDAVGDGMHKLSWDVRSSKRFDWIEPYFGLNYTLQLLARNSPLKELKDIDDANAGQSITQPPHKGNITIGTEFIPYENEDEGERYAIDLRFSFGYTSEGRDYSPLYNFFVDNRCNGKSLQGVLPEFEDGMNGPELTNPEDLGCAWIAQRPANSTGDDPAYDLNRTFNENPGLTFQSNGIMTVESYATWAGQLGFHAQPSEYVQLKALVGLTHQQEHFLTNGRTGRDGSDPDGNVDLTGPNAELERNPAYNPTYDSPGNRFRINEYNTWSFIFNAAFQF